MHTKHYLLIALICLFFSCQKENKNLTVVPYPDKVEMKCGTFSAAGAGFQISEDIDEASVKVIERFAENLALASGQTSKIKSNASNTGFVFSLDASMPSEAYSIKIGRKSVKVSASALNGFNYAVQTLKQMLPVEIFGNAVAADADWTLPCCEINDAPRFSYRGMHMDVSRHFFDVDAVKRYLDVMEIHKLNTLHWHLTDDQGWRVEIKKYPKLTEVGSIRNKTVIGHISRSNEYDYTRYGEGYWYSRKKSRISSHMLQARESLSFQK